MRISVVGTGHGRATDAAGLAALGHEVLGIPRAAGLGDVHVVCVSRSQRAGGHEAHVIALWSCTRTLGRGGT